MLHGMPAQGSMLTMAFKRQLPPPARRHSCACPAFSRHLSAVLAAYDALHDFTEQCNALAICDDRAIGIVVGGVKPDGLTASSKAFVKARREEGRGSDDDCVLG